MAPGDASGTLAPLRAYLEARHGKASGWARDALVGAGTWLPGLAGLVLRSAWLRLWIQGEGWFVAERGVRILGAAHLTIDRGVYLDEGVYLHGRPGGLSIGAGTRVMRGAILHVYNFRDLPGSGIRIGRECVIGMNAVITGQGGVTLEDGVIVAPGAMILPVDHVHEDPGRLIRDQGITARGIHLGKGAWIGAGAVILDGVRVGENAVVGAGSVVTREVPGRSVVAGNPAQVIKDYKGGGGS